MLERTELTLKEAEIIKRCAREMTQKKALEIVMNVIVEKTAYLNPLKYQAQQIKDTDLHAASVKMEIDKTREEITAIITVTNALHTYRDLNFMEGKKNEL